MTDAAIDRIRFIFLLGCWTAFCIIMAFEIQDSVWRTVAMAVLLAGALLRPTEPGAIPAYEQKLTWRDAIPFVALLLLVALAIVAANAEPTRGFFERFGDLYLRNIVAIAGVAWILGTAGILRMWYRRGLAPPAATTR